MIDVGHILHKIQLKLTAKWRQTWHNMLHKDVHRKESYQGWYLGIVIFRWYDREVLVRKPVLFLV
ncbi:hypothetical protein AB835_01860 [Candidatus Endobugula sertula]|uniref:Uncharacterized protein n=1 Tax=Candidatus Endobugula sertula TaxID=62101 RepID=A0A1D2QTA5_9GAMM|nr:hypothetical protein AB835_01860 [Candidatus Endobugula sertula]